MGVKWDQDPEVRLVQLTEQFTKEIILSGKKVANTYARDIDNWMQDNIPWKDDTFRARRGLAAWVDETTGPIGTIRIEHNPSIDYPIWLEIANQGRFSIIRPTLDFWVPRLRQGLQGMANLGIITLGKKKRAIKPPSRASLGI